SFSTTAQTAKGRRKESTDLAANPLLRSAPESLRRRFAGTVSMGSEEHGAAAQNQTSSASEEEGISTCVWLPAIAAQIAILLWIVRTEITGRVFVSSWTLSMPGVLLLLILLTWNAVRRRRPLHRVRRPRHPTGRFREGVCVRASGRSAGRWPPYCPPRPTR